MWAMLRNDHANLRIVPAAVAVSFFIIGVLGMWALALLSVYNFVNLLFWANWAWTVSNGERRQQYVLDRWMHRRWETPSDAANAFAATFTMSNLLLFDFIADHSDHAVASTVCKELFKRWQDEYGPSRRSVACVGVEIPMHPMEL